MHLALSKISFDYPVQGLSARNKPLLHQVSLSLAPGEIIHIQGPNGSGKSSLLNLLAGILRPDEGEIHFAEQDIWSNITAYQHHIQYLGHKNGINPALTVWEHCHLDWHIPLQIADLRCALQDLTLWSVKDRVCETLSAGQKRRVALLRLILSPAQIWILDEPLVALDADGVAWLIQRLQDHITKGGQVIYSSHQSFAWQSERQHRVFVL